MTFCFSCTGLGQARVEDVRALWRQADAMTPRLLWLQFAGPADLDRAAQVLAFYYRKLRRGDGCSPTYCTTTTCNDRAAVCTLTTRARLVEGLGKAAMRASRVSPSWAAAIAEAIDDRFDVIRGRAAYFAGELQPRDFMQYANVPGKYYSPTLSNLSRLVLGWKSEGGLSPSTASRYEAVVAIGKIVEAFDPVPANIRQELATTLQTTIRNDRTNCTSSLCGAARMVLSFIYSPPDLPQAPSPTPRPAPRPVPVPPPTLPAPARRTHRWVGPAALLATVSLGVGVAAILVGR